MRVILVESSHYKPLNPYFDKALEELSEAHGWTSKFVDEADFFPNELSVLSRLSAKLLGDYYRWRRRLFNRHIQEFALVFRPDVLLLVNGKTVAPDILRAVKRGTRARLVNYATDDPFNPLVTTRYFRESVPEFDIYATPKKALMQDLAAAGCRNAVKTLFVYKPELHFEERPATVAEKRRFECDVAFIGSCDHDRPKFLQALLKSMPTIRLSIYGANGWERHRFLRPYLRGSVTGRELRLAVGGAKIALNFIRHTNRDDHSERAFQLAGCRAFILSERTAEQVELLAEDREAAYFSAPAEFAEKVSYYLNHDAARDCIATAGHERVINDDHTSKNRLFQILSLASQGFGTSALRA